MSPSTRAHDYDNKGWQKKMIGYIIQQLVNKRHFFGYPKEDGETFNLLDYASGPGTISAALAPYTTRTLAVDISTNMISEYLSRFPNRSSHSAVTGNLLASTPWLVSQETSLNEEELSRNSEYNNFDAVIVGLGFHHFDDWAFALEKLSRRVKKGGVVGIVDLIPDLDASRSSHYLIMHMLILGWETSTGTHLRTNREKLCTKQASQRERWTST
jgi:ubiquinone/menaquinone biosynthesis C-methylase UbiE